MNIKATVQALITELMEDFARFPERMIPLGPVENLQMKIEQLLHAREQLLIEANRGAECNARVNDSLASQLNAALTTIQKAEAVMARMAEEKAAAERPAPQIAGGMIIPIDENANARFALVRQLNAAEAKLAKIREVLDGYPAAQGLKNN